MKYVDKNDRIFTLYIRSPWISKDSGGFFGVEEEKNEKNGVILSFIVKRRTKQQKTSTYQNTTVFFIQKHLYTTKNTCMFRGTVVN